MIVETPRLGKSTHTVPLMFWALRSSCVCLQYPYKYIVQAESKDPLAKVPLDIQLRAR